jgi:hypothetical protein
MSSVEQLVVLLKNGPPPGFWEKIGVVERDSFELHVVCSTFYPRFFWGVMGAIRNLVYGEKDARKKSLGI